MPTITYKRTWCKSCNDWTLHYVKDENKLICKECKTEFTSIKLIEIPEDKLIEQRKRYTESQNPFTNGLLCSFFNPNKQLNDMFSEVGSNINVIEEDAGQIKIGEQNIIEYNKRAEERQKQREEALKYKGLNRNDTCICGSGKKYKHCCLNKFKN